MQPCTIWCPRQPGNSTPTTIHITHQHTTRCDLLYYTRVVYPQCLGQDGFTHLTADPTLLVSVANHFYQNSPGQWTVLELTTAALTGDVRYEPAAPVGDTAAHDAPQLFPHLYGGINKTAVLREHPMTRDSDGCFVGVPSLGIF